MAAVLYYMIGLLHFVPLSQALSMALPGTLGDMPDAWKPPPDYAVGTSNHKTMYLADLVVGGGPAYRLLVDTGSSLLVVPGAHCESRACAQHRRLRADEGKLTGRTAEIGYGIGSIKGRMLEDKVCLPSPDGTETLDAIGFLQLRLASGCTEMSVLAADEESDDFASSSFDGILGLGLPDFDVLEGSCLLEKLHQSGQISSTDFSLRLGETGDSELVLGGVDEESLAGPGLLWVPLSLAAGSYWQFSVLDIAVDGKPLGIGQFDVLLDSGTSLISADPVVKNSFMKVASPSGDCSSVNSLPKVTFLLSGDVSLPFLPSDYVDRARGECSLAIMPGDFGGVNGQRMVLGDSFMRRYITTFDRMNRRIGFGVNADERFKDQLLPNMFPGHTHRPRSVSSTAPPDVNSKSAVPIQPDAARQQSRLDALSNMYPPPSSPFTESSAPSNTNLDNDRSLSPALEPPNPGAKLLNTVPLPPPPPSLNGSLPDSDSNEDVYVQSTTLGPVTPQEAPPNAVPLSPSLSTLRAGLPAIDLNDEVAWGAPNQKGLLSNMNRPSPRSFAGATFPGASSEKDENSQPTSPQKDSQTNTAYEQGWVAGDTSQALTAQDGAEDAIAATVSPADDPPQAGNTSSAHDSLSDAVNTVMENLPTPSQTPSQTDGDLVAKMHSVASTLSLRNPYMNKLNLIQRHHVVAPKATRRQIVLPLVRFQ